MVEDIAAGGQEADARNGGEGDRPAECAAAQAGAPPFAVFRAAQALPYGADGPMISRPMSDAAMAGGSRLAEAGVLDGSSVRLLLSRPGMSLTHVWFKSGFPLPRHSHDADCLYYIVAGSLRLGNEDLGPGDGFFIGAGVPYTYVPGPAGVEVLEFRTANLFDINVHANNPAYWDKALAAFLAVRDDWADEAPPSGRTVG